MSGPMRRNGDGSWSPATALGWQDGGIDFEVYTDQRPMRWVAYDEDMCVGIGTARTRFGLSIALRRARRRLEAPR